MSEHLSPAELIDLTHSAGKIAQMRWLASRCVPFRFNGRAVYVLRSVAKEWELLQGRSQAVPNMDAVV